MKSTYIVCVIYEIYLYRETTQPALGPNAVYPEHSWHHQLQQMQHHVHNMHQHLKAVESNMTQQKQLTHDEIQQLQHGYASVVQHLHELDKYVQDAVRQANEWKRAQ